MRKSGVFVGAVVVAASVAVAVPQAATRASTTPQVVNPLPQVDVGSVSVQEGNVGAILVKVPVTLSQPAPALVTMTYTVSAGTAGPGDFVAKHGRVSFLALKIVERYVAIKVNGDTLPEGNKTVLVKIASVVGATVHSDTGVLTIVDDDASSAGGAHARPNAAAPEISIGSTSMYEGDSGPRNVMVPITLSDPPSAPVTINFSTGCDTTGADIVPLVKKVTFPIGVRIKEIAVKVLPNTQPSADETMPDQAKSGLAGDGTGQIDVLDDDGYTPPNRPVIPPPPGILRVSDAPGGQDPTFPDSVWAAYGCKGRQTRFQLPRGDRRRPIRHFRIDGRQTSFPTTPTA